MDDSNAPQFVNDLLNYLIGVKNLSVSHANHMKITVLQFLEFINTHKFENKYKNINEFTLNDLRSLSNSDIYSYIYFLSESHFKLNTRILKTEHLRKFFDYLFRIKHTLFSQPFKKINCERKMEKALPNYLTLEESKRVLSAYNTYNKNDLRNIAILYLYFKENLSSNKIAKLNIEDAKKFKGKTLEAINSYLKIRNASKLADEDALFLSSHNKRLNCNHIVVILEIIIKPYINGKQLITKSREILAPKFDEIIEDYKTKKNTLNIRNTAILYMLLNCGLRLSEILNLKINDFNLNENRFSIIGKGNKERTGYLNENTRKALDEYLKIRLKMNIKTKILFVSEKNRKMDPQTLRNIVKKAYTLAHIDSTKYSVHTLRHTFATLLYKAGIGIRTIQILLGHSRIETTQIYTHLYNKQIEEVMLGHPLAQFKMSDALALSL